MERNLPHSVEAEQAVLASCIINPDSLAMTFEKLSEEDFFLGAHKVIYQALLSLFTANMPVDFITLKNQLGGRLDATGGIEYVVTLVDSIYTTENLSYHIDIVREKSMLRQLLNASGEITKMGYEQNADTDTILDRSEQLVFDVTNKRGLKDLYHIRDIIADSIQMIEDARESGGRITGIPTGFNALDNVVLGLHKSDLILLAARPGMGKTSFAQNIVANVAIKAKQPVALFSLEMSREQLVNRFIWSQAGVRSDKMRTGNLDEKDMSDIAYALGKLSKAPIYIDDTPALSVNKIKAKCRRLKSDKGLSLVVIDYLQLMQGRSKSENRQQEISEISRGLKIMAKELDIPVVTLSQLSRAAETRSDKRPMLSDLRESGAIEQDADIVMFLYRDGYYNEDTENKNITELIIAKHRNGETCKVQLAWREESTTFTDLDYRHG